MESRGISNVIMIYSVWDKSLSEQLTLTRKYQSRLEETESLNHSSAGCFVHVAGETLQKSTK